MSEVGRVGGIGRFVGWENREQQHLLCKKIIVAFEIEFFTVYWNTVDEKIDNWKYIEHEYLKFEYFDIIEALKVRFTLFNC